jgi:hypothetical protein
MIEWPTITHKQKVGAVLGGVAWALLGVSLSKMFGGDLESQLLVAVCDSTAGALVWLAFDAPPSPHNKARNYLREHGEPAYHRPKKSRLASGR